MTATVPLWAHIIAVLTLLSLHGVTIWRAKRAIQELRDALRAQIALMSDEQRDRVAGAQAKVAR